ncbi:hypothetical protein Tco_0388293, partial [Tanacetum coccineum]
TNFNTASINSFSIPSTNPSAGQEEVSTGYAEGVNTSSIKVSTVSGQGSIKVSTVSGQVSTDSIKMSIPSPNKGQREGKSPMIITSNKGLGAPIKPLFIFLKIFLVRVTAR